MKRLKTFETPIIVIDSGPLIATLHRQDRYHQQAIAGFRQLQVEQHVLVLPLPIVFEVYRWLMQQQGPKTAQIKGYRPEL